VAGFLQSISPIAFEFLSKNKCHYLHPFPPAATCLETPHSNMSKKSCQSLISLPNARALVWIGVGSIIVLTLLIFVWQYENIIVFRANASGGIMAYGSSSAVSNPGAPLSSSENSFNLARSINSSFFPFHDVRMGPYFNETFRMLYNGIVLPKEWPPKYFTNEMVTGAKRPPFIPPYLRNESRPKVVFIDVGRQVLSDDFLIAEMKNIESVCHRGTQVEEPLLHAGEVPWERNKYWWIKGNDIVRAGGSEGVYYDGAAKLWRMWYTCGSQPTTKGCYATSTDGEHYVRPRLQYGKDHPYAEFNNTNVYLYPSTSTRGKFNPEARYLDIEPMVVIYRPDMPAETEDPNRRRYVLKQEIFLKGSELGIDIFTGSDGLHWEGPLHEKMLIAGDANLLSWNPFRQVFVYTLRENLCDNSRVTLYWETPDLKRRFPHYFKSFFQCPPRNEPDAPVLWQFLDDEDAPSVRSNRKTDLYYASLVAYESGFIMVSGINTGEPDGHDGKLIHVGWGYSRDGFHWQRCCKRTFLAEATVARNYLLPTANGVIIRDNVMDIHYMAYAMENTRKPPRVVAEMFKLTLRRDGFRSLKAGEEEEGSILTVPLAFHRAKYLFVNVVVGSAGFLCAEIKHTTGEKGPVAGYSREDCECIGPGVDQTTVRVPFSARLPEVDLQGNRNSPLLAGEVVQIQFFLRDASIYSFWVTDDPNGASYGFLGSGAVGKDDIRDFPSL
jgi:hypothetical protein